MAIALVASTKITPSSTGGTTPAIDTTGANLLVVGVSYFGALGALLPTDSKGNTWTGLTLRTDANLGVRLCYVMNPTVGGSHTFTFSGANYFACMYAAAFSGADIASVFEAETGAMAAQAGSITPAGDGRLFVIADGHSAVSGALSINEGFTITGQDDYAGSSNFGGALAYLVQGAAAARNPTWSSPSTPGAAMATFKPSSASPVATIVQSHGAYLGAELV